MPGLAFALLGPISLISSYYHRRYIWHHDNPALNPYHYMHDMPAQIVPNATEALMSPALNTTLNNTTIALPTPSVFEMPKPVYFVWLFGLLLGILLTLYTFAPLEGLNNLEGCMSIDLDAFNKSKAKILASCKAQSASKLGYKKLAELWHAQFDDLLGYYGGVSQRLADSWHTKFDDLTELWFGHVKKAIDDGTKRLRDLRDTYEALRKLDKEEIQRLSEEVRRLKEENDRKDRDHEDENNRKDREHDEEMGRKDRDHADEMDQKDRDHAEEMGRKDRDHADKFGQMEKQLRDSEQKRNDAEQRESDSAKKHQKELDEVKRSHQEKMEKATSENNTKMANVKAECDASISEFKSDHDGDITDLKDDLKAAAVAKEAEMKADHEADLAAKLSKKDKAHEAEVAKINQERINTLNKNTKNLTSERESAVNKVKRDNEAESKQAKRNHEKAMDELKDRKDSEIAIIKSESQADKEKIVKTHQEAIAEVRRAHKALQESSHQAQASSNEVESNQAKRDHEKAMDDLKDQKDSEIAELKSAIAEERQAHKSQMQAQESSLKAQVSDLEARHSEEISDAHKSYAEHFADQLNQETAHLEEEIAELKAALGLEKGKARAQDSAEGTSAGPSTQGPIHDDHSVEDPLGGDGSDKSEVDVSTTVDDTPGKKKKRARKQRGVDNKAKLPEALSAEHRRVYIRQTAGRKSDNGRIRFTNIDWAAITDPLTKWNGANIEWLIDEAKIIAQKERRRNVVIQRDFENAIPNIDHIGGIQSAEAAASSSASALSWDNRRSLFENFRAKEVKRSDDVNLDVINQMTIGFNGVEVQRVVNVAIKQRLAQEMMITRADLVGAILEHKTGLPKYERKDPAWDNDTGDLSGDHPVGNGPWEPNNDTPPHPLPLRPPPTDGSIRAGHAPYTPPHRLLPRPPPTDGSIRPGYEVYIPRFPWP